MRYVAVVCPRCGRASAARAAAKRHQCPYCGHIMQVEDVSIIAVGDARSVRQAVVRYNTQIG
jgi:DNA-directed RNA polymerase subunit RPC12/RpoP